MQQYFCETPLNVGEEYIFTKEQAHHARDVVRLDHEMVRLVYRGTGYYAECYKKGNEFAALVKEEDPRVNESCISVTLAAAMIRREKFELVLQKAAELGVSRIVPFESSRCVVRQKKEKEERQLQRWNDIVREAAEQCKRNIIPEVTPVIRFSQLDEIRSEANLACYENAFGRSSLITDAMSDASSVTVVIGPEGGFSPDEVQWMEEHGYEAVTLGSRILRAETAALYACAVIAEEAERRDAK